MISSATPAAREPYTLLASQSQQCRRLMAVYDLGAPLPGNLNPGDVIQLLRIRLQGFTSFPHELLKDRGPLGEGRGPCSGVPTTSGPVGIEGVVGSLCTGVSSFGALGLFRVHEAARL